MEKWTVAIIIALLLILSIGGYLVLQHSATKTYESPELGVKVNIPKDWSATYKKYGSTGAEEVTIQSPDYHETATTTATKVGEEQYPGTRTEVIVSDKGARLRIFSVNATNMNKNILEPGAYTQFYYSVAKDCSNCFDTSIITLSEQPALKNGVMGYSDLSLGDTLEVSTVRNGKVFSLIYNYDLLTPDKQKIFNTFVGSFEFTK